MSRVYILEGFTYGQVMTRNAAPQQHVQCCNFRSIIVFSCCKRTWIIIDTKLIFGCLISCLTLAKHWLLQTWCVTSLESLPGSSFSCFHIRWRDMNNNQADKPKVFVSYVHVGRWDVALPVIDGEKCRGNPWPNFFHDCWHRVLPYHISLSCRWPACHSLLTRCKGTPGQSFSMMVDSLETLVHHIVDTCSPHCRHLFTTL
jgi:hypothetical protein